MHAHERTMLARLGFADPDRREQLHDLACQYLATPEAVRRLIKHLSIERGPTRHTEGEDPQVRSLVSWDVPSHYVNHEVEISKGYGNYRTTVGFADIVFTMECQERHVHVQRRRQLWRNGNRLEEWGDWESLPDMTYSMHERYGVEVKITPTSTGDVIRQVKLYRTYSGITHWIVATTYGLATHDVALLRNENIAYIRLGERFRQYVAARQASEQEAGVEI